MNENTPKDPAREPLWIDQDAIPCQRHRTGALVDIEQLVENVIGAAHTLACITDSLRTDMKDAPGPWVPALERLHLALDTDAYELRRRLTKGERY